MNATWKDLYEPLADSREEILKENLNHPRELAQLQEGVDLHAQKVRSKLLVKRGQRRELWRICPA